MVTSKSLLFDKMFFPNNIPITFGQSRTFGEGFSFSSGILNPQDKTWFLVETLLPYPDVKSQGGN